ncbi:hypothetical protein BT63DRAFT_419970 [Microthyrium microscopicum]|uniref:Ankyrin n=1 Tax=Microthyrium microscopicum TaxID=703497 RepID=A0A6A6UQX6_9PEZI|nr:hypothetical protein BT63DRAFT_419970 [Microthyrium microscopicum]
MDLQNQQSTQRTSLRYDAALRACRDGDLSTVQKLINEAQLFKDPKSLRKACENGTWGTGVKSSNVANDNESAYDTTDSIRLHTMLQTATTRSHTRIVVYLLDQFPARGLHIAEWEVVVNALGSGSMEMLTPFLAVDPDIVHWVDDRLGGTVFGVINRLVEEWEKKKALFELLVDHGADLNMLWRGSSVLDEALDEDCQDTIEWMIAHGAKRSYDMGTVES